MHKAYAHYFVSYLMANLKSFSNIESIILFGSVAKNEATKESDVDVFIEIKKESKKFAKEVDQILELYYKSREALLFKAKGIDNKINLVIGYLSEWKELKASIESTGILLYGKYKPSGIEGKKYAVIFWDQIRENRGSFLNKVYGVKIGEKRYPGLIEKLAGKKLGKSSIMVPIEHREEILKLLAYHKVRAKIVEVYG